MRTNEILVQKDFKGLVFHFVVSSNQKINGLCCRAVPSL